MHAEAPPAPLAQVSSRNVATVPLPMRDGTATTDDNDYIGRQGTLTFGIGEDQQTLSIEIPGDFKNELLETFTVEFTNEVEMVLLDRVAQADIRDADPGAAPVPGVFAIYTEDAQFDTGSLVSVHHDTPLNDQLQLVENGSTFPFIWVALSDFGTIVKIDVETGEILGEYSTSPDNRGSNPSRTTVALDGSVWVGNRSGQSVTHVGLPELNQCVDQLARSQLLRDGDEECGCPIRTREYGSGWSSTNA